MSRLDDLRETRRNMNRSLFLVRCVIAWAPIAAFHLLMGRPISPPALVFYVVAIPAALVVYDRYVLRGR